jgi:hypothetical protein
MRPIFANPPPVFTLNGLALCTCDLKKWGKDLPWVWDPILAAIYLAGVKNCTDSVHTFSRAFLLCYESVQFLTPANQIAAVKWPFSHGHNVCKTVTVWSITCVWRDDLDTLGWQFGRIEKLSKAISGQSWISRAMFKSFIIALFCWWRALVLNQAIIVQDASVQCTMGEMTVFAPD